jgi:replicative DNA helicase
LNKAAIWKDAKRPSSQEEAQSGEATKVVAKSKITLEEHVLGLVFIAPQFIDFFFNKMVLDDFRQPEMRRFFENLQTFYNSNDEFQIKNWLKSLNKNDEEFVNRLTLKAEDEFAEAEEEQLGEELFNAVARLKRENLAKDKSALSVKIKQAEQAGEKNKLLDFMSEFQNLIEIERNL